jgi:DNA-binding response OmpR family regulator
MAHLLIVDDDLDFASAVATALRSRGHEVDIETDCEQALPRIQQRRPEAVILDVMFPENDTAGFEVARSIRRGFGELPILMLTAVNQSFPLGFSNKDLHPTWLPAVAFLEKPVDLGALCTMVAEILAAAPAKHAKEPA